MKKKIIIICIVIFCIVAIMVYFRINSETEEYIPEQEISEEESNLTTICLYFQNKETKQIEAESRKVKLKDLLQEPYEKIIEMLMNNPENQSLEKIIPEETKINKIELNNYCLTIDFSKQINVEDVTIKNNIKESILKTLTQFNEISEIKILSDGEEIKY